VKRKIKLGLLGASGRMGQKLQELLALQENADFELVWSSSRSGEPSFGKLKTCALDLVIDFSNPKLTLEAAKIVAERELPFLVCTTGFSPSERSKLDKTLSKNAWGFCPNTSLGVLALTVAARQVAEILKGWDIEIVESHHKLKKDSPSGTAKLLLSEISNAGAMANAGASTNPRMSGAVAIHALRGGTEVGEHTIEFFGPDERVRLEHRAQDRRLFARGAIELARRLTKKKARAKAYSAEELLLA
jgi:4-hydroxy-tetrahydrodipicolinate reductase